ncbi:MAG: winged helix-turn-helix domain-containing protein [Natrialbaceae archaeon]|nr:winged helix-turn-helix domain-containing protein [Natrialbaceae archaeon]
MSHPDVPTDDGGLTGDPVARVFGIDDPGPYETQRTVQRYLSQETRHDILQVILGHPAHLPSLTEFAYYMPKSRSTISEHLADLEAHEILERSEHEPNADQRDLPEAFWGLTPFGVDLLAEFNYLRGLPIMRAAHDATHKTETIRRHEAAPRPELPVPVREALVYEEPEAEAMDLTERRNQTLYAEAAPPDPAVLNDGDGDRTLDELFGA